LVFSPHGDGAELATSTHFSSQMSHDSRSG
jgi:hypothetical protein